MRAAQRLRNDGVNQLQLFQTRGNNPHRFGGQRRFIGAFPQNGGTAFRGDNGIGAVLQHIHFITHADCQRAAGTTFTDNGADNRDAQTRHFAQVTGNRLRLAALFRAHARIRTRSVDKGADRHFETLSHLHQAQRFTIAFRRRHTEVAANFLFGFAPFLVADNHYRTPVQTRNPADDSFIVSIGTVTGQFVEFVESQADIIQGVRATWMARQLRNLPCTKIGEDLARQLYALFTQAMHFFIDINIQFLILAANRSQRIDFRFQLCNRLFKIKEIQTHSIPVLVKLQFHLLRADKATQIVK